jgi:WD40 repeat protein
MRAHLALAAVVVAASPAFAQEAKDVRGIAFAPDAKSLVVALPDKTARVLELPSGKELRRLTGFPERPESLALSPDGKTIALGGFAVIALYETETAKLLAKVEDPLGHLDVSSLAFSPDGKLLLAGGSNHVRLLDGATGKLARKLLGCQYAVNVVAFSPDGKVCAATGIDQKVFLWDAETGKAVETFAEHKSHVVSLAWAPDGKSLATVDDRRVVHVWDLATGQELATVDRDTAVAYRVVFLPDGKTLAWANDMDGSLHVWDLAGKKELLALAAKNDNPPSAVALSPDGKTIAVGGWGPKLVVHDTASKTSKEVPLAR